MAGPLVRGVTVMCAWGPGPGPCSMQSRAGKNSSHVFFAVSLWSQSCCHYDWTLLECAAVWLSTDLKVKLCDFLSCLISVTMRNFPQAAALPCPALPADVGSWGPLPGQGTGFSTQEKRSVKL